MLLATALLQPRSASSGKQQHCLLLPTAFSSPNAGLDDGALYLPRRTPAITLPGLTSTIWILMLVEETWGLASDEEYMGETHIGGAAAEEEHANPCTTAKLLLSFGGCVQMRPVCLLLTTESQACLTLLKP